MKEFLRELGITQQGEYTEDNNYVIDLENSNEFKRKFQSSS